MTKLSFCAIVRNEENDLPKCLTSVREVVDEIIILDTGSTDRTVEIAEKFGAKVFYFDWCDDFSAARNEALKYVGGEWVLVLDADEILNPEIESHLKQIIAHPDNLVVNLIRQEVGASQSPYSLVSRLFRKHPKIKFSRPYHSIIDDSVAEIIKQESNWNIIDTNLVGIFHHGYQPEAILRLGKFERARKAMESFFARNPSDPYTCSKLGALYLQIGQKKTGVKLLKQGLKSNRSNPHILYELHYHLGNAYNSQGKLESASKHYQKALEQPILPRLKLGAYNNLGSLLQTSGGLHEAQKNYEAALQIDPTFAIGYYNLGMTFKAMGKLAQAIGAYQQAIKLNPDYAPAHQSLAVVLLKMGYFQESIEAFEKAIGLYESQGNLPEAQRLRQGLQEIGM